jgi:hypothetical protein
MTPAPPLFLCVCNLQTESELLLLVSRRQMNNTKAALNYRTGVLSVKQQLFDATANGQKTPLAKVCLVAFLLLVLV